jgi:hypothetical protein
VVRWGALLVTGEFVWRALLGSQPDLDQPADSPLAEDVPQDLALTEAAKPVNREGRMVRNPIVEIELAEPAVGKMQRNFLAQPALMTNAIAVPD